jgi:hypothetical protein
MQPAGRGSCEDASSQPSSKAISVVLPRVGLAVRPANWFSHQTTLLTGKPTKSTGFVPQAVNSSPALRFRANPTPVSYRERILIRF